NNHGKNHMVVFKALNGIGGLNQDIGVYHIRFDHPKNSFFLKNIRFPYILQKKSEMMSPRWRKKYVKRRCKIQTRSKKTAPPPPPPPDGRCPAPSRNPRRASHFLGHWPWRRRPRRTEASVYHY